jgi:hypothetical protein
MGPRTIYYVIDVLTDAGQNIIDLVDGSSSFWAHACASVCAESSA